jgi:hypothetical protein
MVDDCPYCGEEQSALKNHVRLASGEGHGPSGQYPDDFDRGAASSDVEPSRTSEPAPEPAEPPAPGGGGGAVAVEAVEGAEEDTPQEVPKYDDGDETEVVALPEDKFEGVVDVAYDAGGQDVEEEDVVDAEATTVDSADKSGGSSDEVAISSGGITLGTVLLWVIILPLLTVIALAAMTAGADVRQNQNDSGHQLGPSVGDDSAVDFV